MDEGRKNSHISRLRTTQCIHTRLTVSHLQCIDARVMVLHLLAKVLVKHFVGSRLFKYKLPLLEFFPALPCVVKLTTQL